MRRETAILVVALVILAITAWTLNHSGASLKQADLALTSPVFAQIPGEGMGEDWATEETMEVSKEDLTQAIREYIEKDTRHKGGYFLLYDRQAMKPLVLTFNSVKDEPIRKMKDGSYSACADFKTAEGLLYDVDISMMSAEKGLEISDISIHKDPSKERYTLIEEDGLWVKQYQ